MSTTMKYGVVDQPWENKIDQTCADIYAECEEIARDQAVNNIPKESVDEKESRPYVGSIVQKYQSVIDENAKVMQTQSKARKVDRVKKDVEAQLDVIESKKSKVENNIRIESRAYDKHRVRGLLPELKAKEKRSKRILPIVGLICATDSLVSASVLQNLGISLWVALLLGTTLGLGMLVLAHQLPNILHKAETKAQKRSRLIAVVAGVTTIFIVFAIFRDGYELKHRMAFIAINLFSFSCASILVYSRALTPTEQEQLVKYGAIQEAIKRLETDKESFEDEEKTLRERVSKEEEEYKSLVHYAFSLERTIESKYLAGYQHYIDINCFHRSDQIVPKFFHAPAPALKFHFQNQSS